VPSGKPSPGRIALTAITGTTATGHSSVQRASSRQLGDIRRDPPRLYVRVHAPDDRWVAGGGRMSKRINASNVSPNYEDCRPFSALVRSR
jgi:hypothetical protein